MPASFDLLLVRDSSFDLSSPAVALATLTEAERLLERGELERAGERFELARRAFEALEDATGLANALFGLGKVLLGLEDPVCREVLEDAGTLAEDLGDERRVLDIEKLLRAAERAFEESPLSYVARSPRFARPPRV